MGEGGKQVGLEISVENVVASTSLEQSVDLYAVAKAFPSLPDLLALYDYALQTTL